MEGDIYFFQNLQEHYNTVYDAHVCSFLLSTEQYTRYFFNTTHQVKAIAIGIVEANPLAEIG